MATIAYILLCHRDPEAIVAQAERLTAAGDCVSIHFDARAGAGDFRMIRESLAGNDRVTFARRRIRCGWGEWSLVAATMQAVEAALEDFPRATHFYMLSGDCVPIKTAEFAHEFLDRNEADYIESFDFFRSDWIRTGIKEERLIYRHYLNERQHHWLFYQSIAMQRRLGLRRRIPADLQVQIGSQWWCLRRRTIEAVMAFARRRRDVVRFFSTTWIPDETFFQTLVRHLVPGTEIRSRTLTFLMFTDYGMPVTFHNDHYDLLLGQDFLFARKVSPEAQELKARLGRLYSATGVDFAISNEGRSLFEFLTGRGRIGHRFAPRFWENEASLGRDRELLIVICKKWHVGKRLVARIRDLTGIPAVDYLFHEERTALPDLGGIQSSLSKRTRHRRSLLRMLFEYFRTSRMVICLDPASLDLLQDFCSDRAVTTLLEVDCDYDDAYLAGHARRTGLASDRTPPEALERLFPTVRNAIAMEADRIRDAGFANHHRIRQSATAARNAGELSRFLAVSPDVAQDLAETPNLFDD
ncbi:epsK domain protein [Pseudooceanicola batsensis HTCC2597]|uniref:Peptide O-xylosyltransferase n=1 Tax=Pseudooceanicola batsensis (strain ATCC BAA-863 / DSM 15984 / KCTC 12145 / HTCC2597) TaxID=252305 RepID=A3U252_PSEBH|nr:DUF5928 domain-containing protein [Pseudooceanicola batsensis]EAQ01652.1 epsK domain protein [Pseudooceanicola batsensis HTCC2597]